MPTDELCLGTLGVTLTTTDGRAVEAKFDLPDGSSITKPFPPSGPLNMKLGLGLAMFHQNVPSGGGGAPEWANVFIDFTESVYLVNGTSRAVGTLFGADADYGGSFNAANISATGMSFEDDVNMPWCQGDLKTNLLTSTDRTYIFEFLDSSGTYPLAYWTDQPGNVAQELDPYGISGFTQSMNDLADWSGSLNADGINKVAIGIDATNVYVSVNGGVVLQDPHGGVQAADRVALGHYGSSTAFGGKIRKITAGPFQGSAALPALSALS